MPEHPIPRPVDLTDLPNPTPPDLPMPPDRTTVGRAAIALQYVMGDGYERGVEILSNCTPDQLRTIAESASMLADLATKVMDGGAVVDQPSAAPPAAPALASGTNGPGSAVTARPGDADGASQAEAAEFVLVAGTVYRLIPSERWGGDAEYVRVSAPADAVPGKRWRGRHRWTVAGLPEHEVIGEVQAMEISRDLLDRWKTLLRQQSAGSREAVQDVTEPQTLPFLLTPPRSAAVGPTIDVELAVPSELGNAPHGCGRCPARWGGTRTAHCAACHVTFGGVSGFDKHRRAGQCLPPAEVGLVELASRPYPCWGSPIEEGPANA